MKQASKMAISGEAWNNNQRILGRLSRLGNGDIGSLKSKKLIVKEISLISHQLKMEHHILCDS